MVGFIFLHIEIGLEKVRVQECKGALMKNFIFALLVFERKFARILVLCDTTYVTEINKKREELWYNKKNQESVPKGVLS